jgi:RNA-directed DNA polymerase
MKKEMTKSLPVSKRMVYESYLNVCARKGGVGIDGESIDSFNINLSKNLYKIWNRMASGSYFPPPVRTVFIPKKQGGTRPLGIPTVGDRIAQGVVKAYLEPSMEKVFHYSSFGYRPGKSAHDALQQCQNNCMKHGWVIDVDIKGFFDNIDHQKLMDMVKLHTNERWVWRYLERWLKAGIEQEDGSIVARTKGTPQGGVISPLLANIYLHYCFDEWMKKMHFYNPFERYADDIVIHCNSREIAESILAGLKKRLSDFGLELHPMKTKLVYCKNYFRNEVFENNSFDFLSYSFHPRTIRDVYSNKKCFLIFNAAICQKAKTAIRSKIKEILQVRWNVATLEWFANKLNPKIRGWVNYYSKFNKREVLGVFHYLNGLICQWIRHTHKLLGIRKILKKLRGIQAENPSLFYHWTLGIK